MQVYDDISRFFLVGKSAIWIRKQLKTGIFFNQIVNANKNKKNKCMKLHEDRITKDANASSKNIRLHHKLRRRKIWKQQPWGCNEITPLPLVRSPLKKKRRKNSLYINKYFVNWKTLVTQQHDKQYRPRDQPGPIRNWKKSKLAAISASVAVRNKT